MLHKKVNQVYFLWNKNQLLHTIDFSFVFPIANFTRQKKNLQQQIIFKPTCYHNFLFLLESINKATNDKTCDPFLFCYDIHGPFGFWFGVQFSTANLFLPVDRSSFCVIIVRSGKFFIQNRAVAKSKNMEGYVVIWWA